MTIIGMMKQSYKYKKLFAKFNEIDYVNTLYKVF